MQQNLGNKLGAQLAYQPVSPHNSNEQWKPSLLRSIPWSGIAGIIIAILSGVGSIIALYSANGEVVDSWPSKDRPIQLAVILAILTAVGNVGLGVAFNEGATLTWWVSMSQGATLGESHRYWEHSSSAWKSFLGLLHLRISKVNLVSILMASHFANGPLIQRATRITTDLTTQKTTFHVAFSPDQLSQPTGYYMSRAQSISTLAGNFSRVVLAYNNRDPIKLDLKGCDGVCSGALIGAGFDVGCSNENKSYSINEREAGGQWVVGGVEIWHDGIGTPGVVNVTTTYKGHPTAKGHLTVTTCLLRSALVRYPISYANGTLTLQGINSMADGTVNRTEKLLYPFAESAGLGRMGSLLGGLSSALHDLFASNVSLYQSGTLAVQGTGPMGALYMKSSDDALGTVNMTWSDPTPSILEAFHQMAFRTAFAFSNSSFEQTVQGTQQRITTKYAINKAFLAASLVITFSNALAIMFLYPGFWRLGRPVTMSPLETANAFNAPSMSDADGLKDVDELAQRFESKVVRYDIGQGKMMIREEEAE
ncbi:hypothetical protein F53441_4024 [Fusarium austroafricanum]|uniref:Uncharacterized protein n=1 Tax=Fusarium austroafricanum TaxID=2364996 RepID=A0A8H4KPP6_9HYPO|nr:hypothetical protein F53441_4024 [Fusarium austroafricanum]